MNNQILYNQRPLYTSQLNINQDTRYMINIPLSFMKSIEGKYFVGVAENLNFGNITNAWARLYNPPNSGVNLFVNVWTVSDIFSTPYKLIISFNTTPWGTVQYSGSVTPSNLAIVPQPLNKVQLQYAVAVSGLPRDGTRVSTRYGLPGTTTSFEVGGNFIFPPGGSFMITMSNPERPTVPSTGSITFAWWEEPII